jgi:hypothetical protein
MIDREEYEEVHTKKKNKEKGRKCITVTAA